MAKYIDWYLVELEALLHGRVRPDKAHDLLTQAETHLSETAEELKATGLSEKDAELVALERFGRARKIANEAIGFRQPQKIAWVLMIGAFVAFVGFMTDWALGVWDRDGVVYGMWISAAAFAIGAFHVRRFAWTTLVAMAVLTTLALTVTFGVTMAQGSGFARFVLADASRSLASLGASTHGEAVKLTKWKELHTPKGNASSSGSGGAAVAYELAPLELVYRQELGVGEKLPVSVLYAEMKVPGGVDYAAQNVDSMLSKLNRTVGVLNSRSLALNLQSQAGIGASAWSHLPMAAGYALLCLVGSAGLNLLAFLGRKLIEDRSPLYRKFA